MQLGHLVQNANFASVLFGTFVLKSINTVRTKVYLRVSYCTSFIDLLS